MKQKNTENEHRQHKAQPKRHLNKKYDENIDKEITETLSALSM